MKQTIGSNSRYVQIDQAVVVIVTASHAVAVEGHMTIIDVEVKDASYKAVVLESPETMSSLKVGNPVSVLFKETEVIIGLDPISGISLRNRVLCTITEIMMGHLLCNLSLESPHGTIHSIITRNAVDSLALKPEMKVWAMIKTNEIMLEF